MEIIKTELFFKVLLHILILFILLLFLFWVVISKVQTNLMTDAVKNSLSNAIQNFKSTYKKDINNINFIYDYIDVNSESSLETELSVPDEKMTNNNLHVKNLGYVYVILIIIVILTFLGTLYGSCEYKNFPFWFILKENIIIFIFIGIIEAAFFYYIGMKYSPVVPSDVNEIVKNKLISKLS